MRPGQKLDGDFAQLLDAEAALAERTKRQKHGDEHFPGRKGVDGQAVKVQGKHAAGQTFTETPENVRHDERRQRAFRIGQRLGEDAARGSRDNGRDDGQQQRGRGAAQGWLVDAHNYEGYAGRCGRGDEKIDPPEQPGEVYEPRAPLFATEDHHVDDGCWGEKRFNQSRDD